MEQYLFPYFSKLVSLHWGVELCHKDCPLLFKDTPQEFVYDCWVFEEWAQPIPVFRLLDFSGFVNAVGSAKATASNDIKEITFLRGCLMWNDTTVCCGRIWLKIFVSVWSDLWKSLERESAMMFLLLWCVVTIGMSRYQQVSIQSIVLLHRGILHSLDQSMLCASNQVRLNCLWMLICVTPVPFVGWSCRCSLLTLGILGGSTWVSSAMLKGFSIAMLVHFRCTPLRHINRRLTISLLMVWQRLCCWLGPPW